MARIINSSNSRISGKVGDLVFFNRGNKSFVRRAAKSHIDLSPKGIARREKFGMSIKLAKGIYSVPELKALWEKNKIGKGTAFNTIQKENYHLVNGRDFIDTPSIIPGLFTSNQTEKTVKIAGKAIRFKLSKDEVFGNYDYCIKDETIIAGVLFLNVCNNSCNEPYRFIGVKGSLEKKGNKDYAVINLNEAALNKMDAYDSFTIYFGLVCGDIGIGNFSRTISK
ncbi:MAG: hypothetical protein WC139_12160 [Candidatus Kapaibacterium sp.]